MRTLMAVLILSCAAAASEPAMGTPEVTTFPWSDPMAIPYEFGKRSPAKFKDAALGAIREWELAMGRKIRFVPADGSSGSRIRFDFDRKYWGPWLGDCSPATYGTQVRLNANLYKWHRGAPFYEMAEGLGFGRSRASLDLVLLHEIGHALGLSHSTNPDDIMCVPIHTVLSTVDAGRVEKLLGITSSGARASLQGTALPPLCHQCTDETPIHFNLRVPAPERDAISHD